MYIYIYICSACVHRSRVACVSFSLAAIAATSMIIGRVHERGPAAAAIVINCWKLKSLLIARKSWAVLCWYH